MKLGINLGYIMKKRGGGARSVEEAARLCADAGFRFVDYRSEIKDDNWLEMAERDRAIFDKTGLAVEQLHAPFNRYKTYAPEDFPVYLQRSFEAAHVLGAKYVVIHADEYCPVDRWAPDEITTLMYDMFAPYVDYAKKCGMGVAIENLFEDHAFTGIDGCSRFTARIDELIGLIERFNDDAVSCCWDFGHARCAFGDQALEALRQAGKYVTCTHVHDNYYGKDLHLLPFLGDTDWEAHAALLKELGYKGKFTYEFVYGRFPDQLMPMALRCAYETGEFLTQ